MTTMRIHLFRVHKFMLKVMGHGTYIGNILFKGGSCFRRFKKSICFLVLKSIPDISKNMYVKLYKNPRHENCPSDPES